MSLIPTIQAAALWGGLLILLLIVLSGVVVRRRRQHLVEFGDGGVRELVCASRAFANATEYIPAGIGGLILLAFLGAPAMLIHAVGGMLFVGRVIHALGLLFQDGPSLGRSIGMILTWLSLLVAALSLIAWSIL